MCIAVIVWYNYKRKHWLLSIYSTFLILYITLLRRAPGYNEIAHFQLKLWLNVDIWVGNLLNLALYIPFGVTSWQWKHDGKKIVFAGVALSIFCELMQYLTKRGMADVNDVLFNTLGAFVGVCIAKKASKIVNKRKIEKRK